MKIGERRKVKGARERWLANKQVKRDEERERESNN